MIDLMKALMEQVIKLQTEDEHLRNVVMNANKGSVRVGTQNIQVRPPDRPMRNTALVKENGHCLKTLLIWDWLEH